MAGGRFYAAHLGSLSGAVLKAMLRQFPFRIQGLHTENGSEFINATCDILVPSAAPNPDDVDSGNSWALIQRLTVFLPMPQLLRSRSWRGPGVLVPSHLDSEPDDDHDSAVVQSAFQKTEWRCWAAKHSGA